MSFFIKDKAKSRGGKKRKAPSSGKPAAKISGTKRRNRDDDDITSEESDADINVSGSKVKQIEDYTSSEDENETADQKRKRLAQEHLEKLKAYISSDEEDDDEDPVARRLKQENLARRGRLHKDVASQYVAPTSVDVTVCRGHQLPVTCVVISPDGRYIFSGSKDCSIIKWSVETGKKVHVIPRCRKGPVQKTNGHTTHVMCLAISSDGQYLASGDRSKIINVWNPETCELLHATLTRQHRNAISGLAFRHGTHELYSASFDRTVKVWNVGDTGIIYVETLFGHQDIITAIDALALERVVTSGGRDGSVRVWKIVEESQLVFHGHSGSIDCVCYVDDSHFFSGADDGSLALWSTMKKKPIVTVNKAHTGKTTVTSTTLDNDSAVEMTSDDSASAAAPLSLPSNNSSSAPVVDAGIVPDFGDGLSMKKENWVTAVAALHNTDLVASGSKDGFIRFWKCGNEYKSMSPLFTLPVLGFVNSLQFSADGRLLIAGIGQEHKLGRWWHIKTAKNAVCIIRLNKLAGSARKNI